MAPSNPWPASTQTVSMSSALASPLRSTSCRLAPVFMTMRSGSRKPAVAPSAPITTPFRLIPPKKAPRKPPSRSPAPLRPSNRSRVQPSGLPARSSSRVSLSPVPDGDSRRARPFIFKKKGTTIRSRAGSSFRPSSSDDAVCSIIARLTATPVGLPLPTTATRNNMTRAAAMLAEPSNSNGGPI